MRAVPGATLRSGALALLPHVKPCPQPPAVTVLGYSAYRTVRVACPSAGWQFYVPIRLSIRGTTVVAARDILPGRTITAADVRVVPSTAPSSFAASSATSVIGRTLDAPLRAGQPIALGALQEPIKVHAGQDITVDVRAGSVRVQTTAVALEQGRVGQSILVRNPKTGKQYRVTVNPAGGASYDLGG